MKRAVIFAIAIKLSANGAGKLASRDIVNKMASKKAVKEQAKPEATAIVLPPLNLKQLNITIVGDSPLICHNWSEKAKKQMLGKQMKEAKTAKEAKDPEKDFQGSLYRDGDGDYAFPSTGLKSCAVDACSHVDGITKVLARGAFHVNGEFVKIRGDVGPREDMVRIGMGTADIRYRGEFKEWEADLSIRYNANVLSAGQIINLFNTGGFAIGIGEWRPERNGSYGMFHVK